MFVEEHKSIIQVVKCIALLPLELNKVQECKIASDRSFQFLENSHF